MFLGTKFRRIDQPPPLMQWNADQLNFCARFPLPRAGCDVLKSHDFAGLATPHAARDAVLLKIGYHC